MYQYKGMEETIAAVSTATGGGSIGIVRLSGAQALEIADQVFESKSKIKVKTFKHATVHYGWIHDQKNNQLIDEVLLTVMKAPLSYTREHVVEISCHGGGVSLKAILNEVLEAGARLAQPGEFTKRAFLNGRIDLTQAEAVLDIIHSRTENFLKVSTNQLKGKLTQKLEEIREALLSLYVEIEAVINFPEDDIDSDGYKEISVSLGHVLSEVSKLIQSSEQGKILKEGIKLVLAGRPNVGKSSLLNCLLRTPRAIVSDVAGTTRDTIEEMAQLKGIPLRIVDTAGLLEPRDKIEVEAVKRSEMNIQGADIILLVLNGNESLTDEDLKIMNKLKDLEVLTIINKSDLEENIDLDQVKQALGNNYIIKVSALKEVGIDSLEAEIIKRVWHGDAVDTKEVMVSNARHIESLKATEKILMCMDENLKKALSLEFISQDVKACVNYLDGITGRNVDDDLLDTIFSQFCIGK